MLSEIRLAQLVIYRRGNFCVSVFTMVSPSSGKSSKVIFSYTYLLTHPVYTVLLFKMPYCIVFSDLIGFYYSLASAYFDWKSAAVLVYDRDVFPPQESLLLPYSLWRVSLLTPMTPPLKTVGGISILRLLSKVTFGSVFLKQ